MAGYFPVDYPWAEPAKYAKGAGWSQYGSKIHVKKPHYHWIWPNDGKRKGKLGRMKDILSGKGPDIHVTVSANKMDYFHNRQSSSRWANHMNLAWGEEDGSLKDPSWVRRNEDKAYDFRTRKYRQPYGDMWTGARWSEPKDRRGWQRYYPLFYRDVNGEWFTWFDIQGGLGQ